MQRNPTHRVEGYMHMGTPYWEPKFFAHDEASANDAAAYLRKCGYEARVVKLESPNA